MGRLMTTDRKFASFGRENRGGFGITEIPPDGFCISTFLIVRDLGNPRRVLMGHLNPEAPWDHIGALTEDRVQAHGRGWMLPSSHLIYGESPFDAALRIAKEQLELDLSLPTTLFGPEVISEVYSPKRFPDRKEHWDLEFLYEIRLREDEALDRKTPNAWIDLSFIDLDHFNKDDIARSHEDILARL